MVHRLWPYELGFSESYNDGKLRKSRNIHLAKAYMSSKPQNLVKFK